MVQDSSSLAACTTNFTEFRVSHSGAPEPSWRLCKANLSTWTVRKWRSYYRLLSHTPLTICLLTPCLTAWTLHRARLPPAQLRPRPRCRSYRSSPPRRTAPHSCTCAAPRCAGLRRCRHQPGAGSDWLEVSARRLLIGCWSGGGSTGQWGAAGRAVSAPSC